MLVNSDVFNSGLIWAHGGNITFNGAVAGSGGALITDANFEFAAASSINVTFSDDSFGTLVLDNPAAYTGQIFGFDSDVLDLKGITFSGGTSWEYSDNAGSDTGGMLTIFETANGITNAIDSIIFGNGDYTSTSFMLTSDGNGGTLVTEFLESIYARPQ